MLVVQQPSLLPHVRRKYDHAGKALFEDANAWVALSEILTNILQDPSLGTAYLIIDGLDECVTGLPQLLELVAQMSSAFSYHKWIVSSRNWPQIEERLHATGHNLSLELNAESVSAAVDAYIRYKVLQLAQRKRYNAELQIAVQQHLSWNAHGTFLWVALVCQSLEEIPRWKTPAKLSMFPPGLDALYNRMMQRICKSDDADLCKQILALMATIYRPISLEESASLVDMPEGMSGNLESLPEIVGLCGSFLTIRDDTVYFVHQSAKDFLLKEASPEIFPLGIEVLHHTVFSRSLHTLSQTLQRDIYNLRQPGLLIREAELPASDPLAPVRYSCEFWVDHLCDANGQSSDYRSELSDDGAILPFLNSHFLHLLESLSLLGKVSEGVLLIRKLLDSVQADMCPNLYALVHSAKSFILYNRSVIENAPLQLYCSALLFAPETSVIRKQFEEQIPSLIRKRPRVQTDWSAGLQTLKGHTSSIHSVAFSPDGKLLASGSYDNTVRLWDVVTGAAMQTLEGHSGQVQGVAFSPVGKLLASASYDNTVGLWDSATGALLQKLEGHGGDVCAVTFSPDGKLLASASEDGMIRLWDPATAALLRLLEGHFARVWAVAFSPNGGLLASASSDGTVMLWKSDTGATLRVLEGHADTILTVAFSPDGKLLASASWDGTVRLWDATTGAARRTLEGHDHHCVHAVAFSPGSKLLASASWDDTVKLWDLATGVALQTLERHTDYVNAVAFSPDGKLLASASEDETVTLWDVGAALQMTNTSGGSVNAVAFSPDGKHLASASEDGMIRLWDPATAALLRLLEGHDGSVQAVTFSPDSKLLASASWDETVGLWDPVTGADLQILEGHTEPVLAVAFSPDGKLLASGSHDNTVELWDTDMGTSLKTLSHTSYVNAVAFSLDGKVLASVSSETIKLWDPATGAALQTLKVDGWDDFSGHGQYLDTQIGLLHFQSSWSNASHLQPQTVRKIYIKEDWITRETEKLIWLPPDYRATCWTVHHNLVALGHKSGQVTRIELNNS